MEKRIGKTSVAIMTEPSPQSLLFCAHIEKSINTKIMILENKENIDYCTVSDLLLIDLCTISNSALQPWVLEVFSRDSRLAVAAYNIKDEDQAAELIFQTPCRGVFYKSDSMETIFRGIRHIINGESWIPYSLLEKLLDSVRKKNMVPKSATNILLTRREIEILQLVSIGMSNSELAATLYLSEHTIKSHLYNIFKKIGVTRRVQAANWARQHAPYPEEEKLSP